MRSWKIRQLSEIGRIVTGKTPSTRDKENFGNKYPFITPKDMVGQKYVSKVERYLSEIGKDRVKNAFIPKDAICVSCIGSDMGKVVMSTQPSVTNQQINSIIVNSSYDPNYIYYSLLSITDELKNIARHGTTMPIINKSEFSKVMISVPFLSEQKAIAATLSCLDDKIELNNRINKTLEEIAQAIFKSWFVDFEPFQDGEFEASELGRIPKGWRVVELGSLLNFVKGKKPKGLVDIKNSNFQAQYLNIHALNGGNPQFAETDKMILANEYDILMVMDGASSGSVYFGLNGIVASTIAKLEINSDNLREVVYQYLRLYESEIRAHVTGSAIPHTDKGYVNTRKIAIPSDEDLHEITRTFKTIRGLIIENRQQEKKLRDIRDTLLPKLMSGEIRVPIEEVQ